MIAENALQASLEAALANAITPYPRPTVPASEVSYGR